jgi:gliding motility-associated-like protein
VAIDNCSSTLTLVLGGAPGSNFLIGTTTVTYEAEDPSGNTVQCSFDVTVNEPSQVGAATLAGSPNVCENSAVVILLTMPPTPVGQSIQWEIQPESTGIWVDVPGQTLSFLNYIATESANFRARVTNGVCTPAYSNEISITVDATSEGGVTEVQTGGNFIAICENESTTIELMGNIGGTLQWQTADASNPIWANMPGETDTTLTVSPLNGTSTVYRVVVTNGLCAGDTSSVSTVVVNSLPESGIIDPSDTLLCEGANATLSAISPLGSLQWQSSPYGANLWTNVPGGNTANIVITGLDSINYRIIATSATCPNDTSDVANVYVHPSIDVNTIMADQDVCDGFPAVPLTGSQPIGGDENSYTYGWESSTDLSTWSSASGTNNLIDYDPLLISDTTYYRRIVESGVCTSSFASISDTVTINWFPTISNNTISADQDICDGDIPAQLNGGLPAGGNGTFMYLWEESTDNVVFTDASGVNNTQNYQPGALTQTTYYRRRIESAPCEASAASYSDTVTVSVFEIPVAYAGEDSDVCGPDFILEAVATVGIGTWSAVPGLTFVDVNDPNSSVSAASYGTYTLTWTEDNNGCITSDDVDLTFYEVPVSNAGTNEDVCGLIDTLNATPSGAWPGHWVVPAGITIDDATSPNAEIIADTYQSYTLQWVEDNNGCTDTSEVDILFIEIPVADAGPGQVVCGLEAVMEAVPSVGDGIWILPSQVTASDLSSPTATMTASLQGSYIHTWVEDNNGCQSQSNVTVLYFEEPVVDAGITQNVCGLNTTLAASSSTGSTSWSYAGPGTLSFSDINSPTATIDADAFGLYTLYLTSVNGICSVIDSVEITFNPFPTAAFSATPEICNGTAATLTFTLTGEAPYEVVYNNGVSDVTLNSSSTVITENVSPSLTTTYTLVSVSDNNACSIFPGLTQTVIVTPQPIADAGTDGDVCFDLINDNYVLSATAINGSGTWTSSPAGLSFSSLSDPNAIVTSTLNGTFELIWTVDSSFCTDADTLYLNLKEIPSATVAIDQTEICIGSSAAITFTMTGIAPFDVVYTDGSNFFSVDGISSNDTTFNVVPVADVTYSLVSVTSANGCAVTPTGQSVSVQVDAMPMPDAGEDEITCWELTDTFQLNGSSDIGSTQWTFIGPGTASFSDAFALDPTLQIDTYGTYSFILSATNNTCTNYDTINVSFNDYPSAFIAAYGDTTICEGVSTFVEIDFTGNPPWGIVYDDGQTEYTVENIMSSPYQLNLAPLVTTSYTISAAFDINACESNDISSFEITVYELPIPVILTTDTVVCGDQIVVESQTPNVGSGSWSSDNSVTFLPDNTELSVVASTSDYGMHTLTWSIDNNGCVESTSLEMDYQEAIPDGSVYAGADQLIYYQFQTQMDAQLPSFAEGTWELISGIGSIDSPNDPNSYVSGLEYGVSNYLWTVSNGICPEVSDSVQIDLRPIQETSGFSPNGDGINDVYVINGLENAAGNEFFVFNNWGDVVYKAVNYANDWDGKGSNGKELPSDTYYFVLKITDVGDYSGYIIIKR